MNKTKPFWQSKTLWGIIIAAGGYLLNKFGVEPTTTEVPNADFAAIQQYIMQVKAAHGSWMEIASVAMAGVGFIISLIGRFQADAKITATTSKSPTSITNLK